MDYLQLQKYIDEQKRLQYYYDLHKQENLWNLAFGLLSKDKKERLMQTLNDLNVVPYKTKIIPLNSALHKYHVTKNGNKPYIILGNHNYTLYGNCDGHPDQILETTGYTPNFFIAYNDVDYRDYMVVTFKSEEENDSE